MVPHKFLMILSVLALSSCSQSVKPVEISTAPVTVAVAKPSNPSPIVLKDIKWKIINESDIIYYGLTVRDYEALAVNMQEIKRYLAAQKNIIKYYEAVTAN